MYIIIIFYTINIYQNLTEYRVIDVLSEVSSHRDFSGNVQLMVPNYISEGIVGAPHS